MSDCVVKRVTTVTMMFHSRRTVVAESSLKSSSEEFLKNCTHGELRLCGISLKEAGGVAVEKSAQEK